MNAISNCLQWNLSIASMLYSGHLSIADTFSRNQLSEATVKLLYFEPLYNGHILQEPMVSAIERFHCILYVKYGINVKCLEV